MNPYYQDDRVTIYHGDCLEYIPKLGGFDLCLTDPPYGAGLDYGGFVDTQENVKTLIDSSMPLLISKSNRVVLTCGIYTINYYPKPSWILCWFNRAGTGRNPWGFSCWSPILVYGKDPYLENRMGGRPDYIEHSETSEKNGHPCPKPEQFWKKLLARCSVKETDTVMDPFMGSGTTMKACKNTGHKCVGIEINERYCEIAANRCRQEELF